VEPKAKENNGLEAPEDRNDVRRPRNSKGEQGVRRQVKKISSRRKGQQNIVPPNVKNK